MSTRTVRKLTDLEIDEVSLVDRPANQHGLVAFAKAYGEDSGMTIYDADGVEVFEDELQHGDVVYDDDGAELQYVEDEGDGTTAELQGDYEGEYEDEDGYAIQKDVRGRAARLALGGSHRTGVAGGRARDALNLRRGRKVSTAADTGVMHGPVGPLHGPRTWGTTAPAGGSATRQYASQTAGRAAGAARSAGDAARIGRVRGVQAVRGNQALAYTGLGAGTAGATAGYANGRRGRVGKSLGQSVYDELSKALTSDDRDQVISKAMDRVSKAEERAAHLEQVVGDLAYERELEEFTEIAKSYCLPVEPETLGRILKNASDTMDDTDLAELDRLLTAQGEMFEALGSDLGGANSEIHAQVEAMALETVGKADVTFEQGVVAVYEANPAAYDEYLQEG